jgi:LysM repeat protein
LIIPSKIESKVNSLAVIAQTNNQEVKGKNRTLLKNSSLCESAIVSNAVVDTDNGEIEVVREVQAKEKYGIAKEYGISVAELEKQNPKKNGLPVGYQLNIRGKSQLIVKVLFRKTLSLIRMWIQITM